MKGLFVILLTAMLLLNPLLLLAKPKTFLQSIQTELQDKIEQTEKRKFDPKTQSLLNDGEWILKVNEDYLRGVVTVFDACDAIPAEPPEKSFWESREFGFILGVALIFIVKVTVD